MSGITANTTTNVNFAPVQKSSSIKPEKIIKESVNNLSAPTDQDDTCSKTSANAVKKSLEFISEHDSLPPNAYEKVIAPANCKLTPNKHEEVFYINGIMTKPASAEKAAGEVANLINKPVKLLYNPTEGFASDAFKATLEVLDIPNSNSIVNNTSKRFCETLKDGKDLKIVAHSRGAAVAAQALSHLEKDLINQGCSKDEVNGLMKKVTIVTIGGASSKEDFPEGIKLVERKNEGDLVPKLAANSGVGRPDDILYDVFNAKDATKKEGLLKTYAHKVEERTMGKIKVAIRGAVVGAMSIVGEYADLKAKLFSSPVKTAKGADLSKVNILDVINKYHAATPNTVYGTGYLNNADDCKAIKDAMC